MYVDTEETTIERVQIFRSKYIYFKTARIVDQNLFGTKWNVKQQLRL